MKTRHLLVSCLLASSLALSTAACDSSGTKTTSSTADKTATSAKGEATESSTSSAKATSSKTKDSAAAGTVTIKDHWDRSVEVKKNPDKVVVMEWEGLVAKTMKLLDVDDRLVGVDSSTKKQPFRKAIIPGIKDAKDVGSAWSGVNYETVASLKPDVVFLEAWVASDENKKMHEDVVKKIEDLGIPVIVMLSPSNFDSPNLKTAWEHVDYVGQLFDKKDETDKIVARMEKEVEDVTKRVEKHSGDAPEAVIFASTSYVMGKKSIQNYLLEDVLKAKNKIGKGTFVEVSEEKLLSYDIPNLIVIGHEGYISEQDVYGGKKAGINWGKVSSMPAIKDKKITTLGYDEWRATLETPIALKKMGKLLYPDEFKDVDVKKDEIDYYKDIYGLSEADAKKAIEDQKFRSGL